jgi:hypothetical protein
MNHILVKYKLQLEITFFYCWELKIISYAKLINPKQRESAASYLFR